MKFFKEKNINWTKERGYKRGIFLPFGNELLSDVQVQMTKMEAGLKSRTLPPETI